MELRRQGATWWLRIEENGRGFDPLQTSQGHGLASMRRRAERLGGRLDVRSSPRGTRLELTLREGRVRSRWAAIRSVFGGHRGTA